MLKKCHGCGRKLSLSSFWKQTRTYDGCQSRCKRCQGGITREARGLRRNAVYTYLLKHPCVDCGESDPVVLHLDHVRGRKIAEVSRLVSQLRPLSVIMAEIKKCEVRCANCHLRRTRRVMGWWSPDKIPLQDTAEVQ